MTKPINEMTMNELAEYAVTLEGWDWRLVDGAKTGDGLRLALWGNDVFVAGPDDENCWSEGQVVGVSTLGSYVDSYHIDEGIDLTDPATLGCLLAMVRKYLGSENIHLRHEHDLGWNLVLDEPGRETWFLESGLYSTEVRAMIAALEKEVQS